MSGFELRIVATLGALSKGWRWPSSLRIAGSVRVPDLQQGVPGQFLHIVSNPQRQGGHEVVAGIPGASTWLQPIRMLALRFGPHVAQLALPVADHPAGRMGRGAATAKILLPLRQACLQVWLGLAAYAGRRVQSGPVVVLPHA